MKRKVRNRYDDEFEREKKEREVWTNKFEQLEGTGNKNFSLRKKRKDLGHKIFKTLISAQNDTDSFGS